MLEPREMLFQGRNNANKVVDVVYFESLTPPIAIGIRADGNKIVFLHLTVENAKVLAKFLTQPLKDESLVIQFGQGVVYEIVWVSPKYVQMHRMIREGQMVISSGDIASPCLPADIAMGFAENIISLIESNKTDSLTMMAPQIQEIVGNFK